MTTDLRYDFAVTRLHRAGAFDATETEAIFAELTEQANARLSADGIPPERRQILRAVDMR